MANLLTAISEAGTSVPTASSFKIDVSNVDFMQVLTVMLELLPTMLPVAVMCIAFRKGISFILSFVRGA